jgi:hypothetical protein
MRRPFEAVGVLYGQTNSKLMKTPLVRTALGLAGAVLIGVALPSLLRAQSPATPAPRPETAAPSPATPTTRFINPSTPQELEIQALGEKAIDRLTLSLMNEVRSTLAGCEPEDVVDMCHLKGLPAGNPIRSMPRITSVKFTSLKIRQPDNAPDPADQLALDYVDRTLKAGDAQPKVLLQKVEVADGSPSYRVYKPIGLTNDCLVCHGDPAHQSAKLRARLQASYPDDQATGYHALDWRGLVRVTVEEEIPSP